MEVSSGQSAWLIAPHFGLWIPARTCHRIRMPGPVSMGTFYLRPGLASALPPGCSVLHVTPLLRELVLETVRVGKLRSRHRHERAPRELAVLHLENASPVPTFVTMSVELVALAGGPGGAGKPGPVPTAVGVRRCRRELQDNWAGCGLRHCRTASSQTC